MALTAGVLVGLVVLLVLRGRGRRRARVNDTAAGIRAAGQCWDGPTRSRGFARTRHPAQAGPHRSNVLHLADNDGGLQ